MRAANILIPARFLTLLGHLCVVVSLLWESQKSVLLCLPSQYHDSHYETYYNRLVAGYGASIALILLESISFIFGLTMFSSSVSLISIGSHGLASILFVYFIIDGWLCDWFWPIFLACSVFPSSTAEHQQLTPSQDYKAGWSFYLVLAAIATTFGLSVPVGYNIGVVNTPAEVIKQFCNQSIIERFDTELSDRWLNVLWSSVVSVFIIGGCTGSVFGATLANNMGRKKTTIVTSSLWLLGALMFVLCRSQNSVEMLILGRLIVGLAGGLTTSIVPMYLTELAPASLTGSLGVACPMGVNVGVLVGQVMGLDFILGAPEDWPFLLAAFSLLVIVCLPMLCILPESPKYLFVVKKSEETAIKELGRLRGVSPSILSSDVSALESESRASEVAPLSLKEVCSSPTLCLPLALVCTMQAGQQTSGINAVFYYSQTIFEQAGLSTKNAQFATIGCGFINVCTAILMIYLLPKFGRRPLLLGSMLGASVILACLAASLRFISLYWWMPMVCTVGVLAYVLVYGLGLGPIPYFIASEMFELSARGAGMSWGSLSNWGGNFLVGMMFPLMRDHIGPYSFLVFATCTAALCLFHKMYFPETRGKSPAEITELCSNGLSSKPLRAPVHYGDV